VAELVAVVERVSGAQVASQSQGLEPLSVDRRLAVGDQVEVSDAGGVAALRLAAGGSLRVAPGSTIALISASEVSLERGAVYFDSGGESSSGSGGESSSGGPALTVRTAWGIVQDIGTQFEVRVLEAGDERALRVRVRDGEARLRGATVQGSAVQGEELTLDRQGDLVRGRVDPAGDAWSWVIASVPPFELERRTLGELLDWVARETGWQVRFEDASLADLRSEILHGGRVNRPDRAHLEILPTSGLEGTVDGGVLTVRALAETAP
jgi:hypothetical protein